MPVRTECDASHRPRVACQWLVGVPESQRFVNARRCQTAPVGAERHTRHDARVPCFHDERLTDVGVPQPDRLIDAGRRQPVAIGAEGHAGDETRVPGQRRTNRLASFHIPQPDAVVEAARGEAAPVGAERHAGHGAGVSGQRCAKGLAGVDVPQPHRFVLTAGGELMTVGTETPRCAPTRCARSGVGQGVGRCRRSTTARFCLRWRSRAYGRPG